MNEETEKGSMELSKNVTIDSEENSHSVSPPLRLSPLDGAEVSMAQSMMRRINGFRTL